MSKRGAITFFLILTASFPALCDTPVSPVDELNTYRVVICDLQSGSPEAADFADNMTALMQYRLQSIASRLISPAYQDYYVSKLRALDHVSRANELDRALVNLSMLELDPKTKPDALKAAVVKVNEAEAALARALKGSKEARLPPQLKVTVTDETYPAFTAGLAAYYASTVDYWIYGETSSLAPGTFYVAISGYEVATKRTTKLFSGVTTVAKQAAMADDAADMARETILGRPWAALHIEAPEGAHYLIDGAPVNAAQDFENLTPGAHFLLAELAGHKKRNIPINLERNKRLTLPVSFEALAANQIYVETDPPADIFLDGRLVGESPIYVDATPGRLLSLRKQGYHTAIIPIGSETSLSYRLVPSEFSTGKEVEYNRTWFYATFGAFVVGLIAPIVSYNFYLDHLEAAAAYANAATPNATRAAEARAKAQQAMAVGWVAAGVDAGLLGFSIYRLYRYVKSVSFATRPVHDINTEQSGEPKVESSSN